MKLVHYTTKDTPLIEVTEGPQHPEPFFKPSGLWVSDDDEYGWYDWCMAEEFHLSTLELAYEIKLVENHNVLILSNIEEIKQFNMIFKVDDRHLFHLDWPSVKLVYDGVIITPYQWELRLELDTIWYNGWDCASGCIWNPKVIKSFDTCQIKQLSYESDSGN